MREGSALRVTPQRYDVKKEEYKSKAYNNALGVDYDSSKGNYGVDTEAMDIVMTPATVDIHQGRGVEEIDEKLAQLSKK